MSMPQINPKSFVTSRNETIWATLESLRQRVASFIPFFAIYIDYLRWWVKHGIQCWSNVPPAPQLRMEKCALISCLWRARVSVREAPKHFASIS